MRTSTWVPGRRRRTAVTEEANGRPAVGQVVSHRGDDGEVQPHPNHGLGDPIGLVRVGGVGMAGVDQAEPARSVQRSPLIMNVAVPSAQHSEMFGQPASSLAS